MLTLCIITLPHNLFQLQYQPFLQRVLQETHLSRSHSLLRPCIVTYICFLHFFFLKLPYLTSNCAYISTFIPTYCLHTAMSGDGRQFVFSGVKNSITARFPKSTSSQPSISTGTEPELRIAVGSRLSMMEGIYHVTTWNRGFFF